MFRVFTAQWMTVVAAAALVASFAAFLTPIAASAVVQSGADAAQEVQVKGDRLPLRVTGSACSAQSWPSFDQKCQFDLRRSVDDVREVRVVSLTRHRSPATK
jgi:hypothetical protein